MWFDKERPNHIHRCARARFYYTVNRCVEGPIHRIDGRARALIGPLANYAYIDQSPAAGVGLLECFSTQRTLARREPIQVWELTCLRRAA